MVLLPTYVYHDLLPERPHSNLLDVLRYNHHIFQGLLQLQQTYCHAGWYGDPEGVRELASFGKEVADRTPG